MHAADGCSVTNSWRQREALDSIEALDLIEALALSRARIVRLGSEAAAARGGSVAGHVDGFRGAMKRVGDQRFGASNMIVALHIVASHIDVDRRRFGASSDNTLIWENCIWENCIWENCICEN